MPEQHAFDAEPNDAKYHGERKQTHVRIYLRKPEANAITSRQPKKNDGFPQRQNHWLPLWERIRAWCHYVHWYGPDYYDADASRAYYDEEWFAGREEVYDPRTNFGFSPVTEEQLRLVEENVGFAHPPLLRDLYLHVANGGFGPASGLTGIPGGFGYLIYRDPRYETMQKEELINSYGQAFCQRVYPELFDPLPFDLDQYEQQHGSLKVICLTRREWPTHLLQVCSGDEEEAFYVHAKSDRVFLAGNAWRNETTPSGEKASILLHWQADSLEEWFERWLAGEMDKRYFDAHTQASIPFPEDVLHQDETEELPNQGSAFANELFDPFLDIGP